MDGSRDEDGDEAMPLRGVEDDDLVVVAASSSSATRMKRKGAPAKSSSGGGKQSLGSTKRHKTQMRINKGKLIHPKDDVTLDALDGPARQFEGTGDDDGSAGKEHVLDPTSSEVPRLNMPNLPVAGIRIDQDAISQGSSFVELLKTFKEIPPAYIASVNSLWNTVPMIRTVFDLSMNALLSGGINISIGSRVFGEEETRYNNLIWSAFARDLVTSLWKYGFAAVTCERHNNDLNFPRVLDLTQIKVMIRPNIYGRMQFLFFTRQDTYGAPNSLGFGLGETCGDDMTGEYVGGRAGDCFDSDKPLTGISVFRESEPTADCGITSRVARCFVPWEELQSAERTYEIAQSRLANPVIVSGRPEQRDQVATGAMGNLPHVPGMRRRDARAQPLNMIQIRQRVVSTIAANNANANIGKEVDGEKSASSVVVDMIDPGITHPTTLGIAHVMLPIGRQIQSHAQPTAPDINAHRSYLEETMAMIFQVPRSVFSATGSGIRSTGAQATANEVWLFGQRFLRQQVLTFLYQMYHLIHTGDNVREIMTRAPELYTTQDDVMKAVAPKITIGSIPDFEKMRDLFQIGVLKYEAFRAYVHAADGLPLDDLESVLQPKLLEPYVEDTIPITESSSSSSKKSTGSSGSKTRQQKVLQRASKGKGGGGGAGSSGSKPAQSMKKALQLRTPSYG